MLHSAWQAVTPTITRNCFRHGGLQREENEIWFLDPEYVPENGVSFVQLISVVVSSSVGTHLMDAYFQFDEEVLVKGIS